MPTPLHELFVELRESVATQVPSFLVNVVEAIVIAMIAVAVSLLVRWIIRIVLKWLAPTWGSYLSNAAQIAVIL